jgi:hypothetical protein
VESFFYLDESGDLGWKFDAPYGAGGSSRHLTLTALIAPKEKAHLPKRIVRTMYEKFGWSPKTEMKCGQLTVQQRCTFAELAVALAQDHPDIQYRSLVVRKENVKAHIRRDPNKLYNYAVKILLIEEMAGRKLIRFFPDARSIKVESGNSMHDYLKTCLLFEANTDTELITTPSDSAKNLNLQFTDFLCGVVNGQFEHGTWSPYKILGPKCPVRTLF